MRLISHCLTPEKRLSAILSLIRFSNLSAPSQFSALPAVIYFFGENQLSPGSIGISPLPTTHPLPFQRESVRPSIKFYLYFSLAMGRSPGFGSNTFDFIRPVQTCFRCGSAPEVLNLAKYIHSPDHSTKGTRSSVDGLSVLVTSSLSVTE